MNHLVFLSPSDDPPGATMAVAVQEAHQGVPDPRTTLSSLSTRPMHPGGVWRRFPPVVLPGLNPPTAGRGLRLAVERRSPPRKRGSIIRKFQKRSFILLYFNICAQAERIEGVLLFTKSMVLLPLFSF